MAFTPLSIAAQFGHLQEVLALIEAGADINVCNHIGWTPIYMAAGNGHDGVVKALIAAGVDIDKTDDIGWTPLLTATEHGHETTVQILIEAGADINKASYNSGWTPLSIATTKGCETILKMLIKAGAVQQPKWYLEFKIFIKSNSLLLKKLEKLTCPTSRLSSYALSCSGVAGKFGMNMLNATIF